VSVVLVDDVRLWQKVLIRSRGKKANHQMPSL
jgi:hypothetical protein